MRTAIRVVIQARIGSGRLPGKIMAPLAGEAMLAHVVRRMRLASLRSFGGFQVTVATTVLPADDATEQMCHRMGVRCYRGAVDDVLARYVAAIEDMPDTATVVRATADNPLYCPPRTVAIVESHIRQSADYTAIEGLSYVVPEVIRAGALRHAMKHSGDPADREHVTPYLRRFRDQFNGERLPATWYGLRPDIPLTVDTHEQYVRMASIFSALNSGGRQATLEEVYAFCDRRRDDPAETESRQSCWGKAA